MAIPQPYITPLNIDFSFIPKSAERLMQYKEENDTISMSPGHLQKQLQTANIAPEDRINVETIVSQGIKDINDIAGKGMFGYTRNKRVISDKLEELQGYIGRAENIQKQREQIAPYTQGKRVIVNGEDINLQNYGSYMDEYGNLKFKDIPVTDIIANLYDQKEAEENFYQNLVRTIGGDIDILKYENAIDPNTGQVIPGLKKVTKGVDPNKLEQALSNPEFINKIMSDEIGTIINADYNKAKKQLSPEEQQYFTKENFLQERLRTIAGDPTRQVQDFMVDPTYKEKNSSNINLSQVIPSDLTKTNEVIKKPTEYSKDGLKGLERDIKKTEDPVQKEKLEKRYNAYVKRAEDSSEILKNMKTYMPIINVNDQALGQQAILEGRPDLIPQSILEFNKWNEKYSQQLNKEIDKVIKEDTYSFAINSINNKAAREKMVDYFTNTIDLSSNNLIYKNNESPFDDEGNLKDDYDDNFKLEDIKIVESKHGMPLIFKLETSYDTRKQDNVKKVWEVELNPGNSTQIIRDISFSLKSPKIFLQYASNVLLQQKDLEHGESITSQELLGPNVNTNLEIIRNSKDKKYYIIDRDKNVRSKAINSDYEAVERMYNLHGGSAYLKDYIGYQVGATSSNSELNKYYRNVYNELESQGF